MGCLGVPASIGDPVARRTLLGWPCKVVHTSATARAAWWESSELGLWGSHPSRGTHMNGDSVCVTPMACAMLSADDVVVFLHSPVTSSAGSSPRLARQQTELSTQEEPSSTKQLLPDPPARHRFVTKPFGETESLPAVTAHGSRGEDLLPPSSASTVLEDTP